MLSGTVILVLLFLPLRAGSQEQVGSIEGVVKDQQGAIVPGSTVEARNVAERRRKTPKG